MSLVPVRVRYVGDFDQVDVPGVGIVDYDEIVDVTPELAGYPPVGDHGDDDYDPGTGLLAQPTNWAPVAPPASLPSTPTTSTTTAAMPSASANGSN